MECSGVRPSVCLSHRLTAATAAGGYAAERPVGRGYRSIAAGTAQQQMRVAPHREPTQEFINRLVCINKLNACILISAAIRVTSVGGRCAWCCVCSPGVVSVVAVGMLVGVCVGIVALVAVLRCLRSSKRYVRLRCDEQ